MADDTGSRSVGEGRDSTLVSPADTQSAPTSRKILPGTALLDQDEIAEAIAKGNSLINGLLEQANERHRARLEQLSGEYQQLSEQCQKLSEQCQKQLTALQEDFQK
jgi:hypothetical protein